MHDASAAGARVCDEPADRSGRSSSLTGRATHARRPGQEEHLISQLVELTWSGDVELANVTQTRREIDDALATPDVARIVIDLAAVRFVDSLGLGMLVYAMNAGDIRGIRVSLRHVPPRTRDLIAVAGLTDVLIIEAD